MDVKEINVKAASFVFFPMAALKLHIRKKYEIKSLSQVYFFCPWYYTYWMNLLNTN